MDKILLALCNARAGIADAAPWGGGLTGNLQTIVGNLDMEIIQRGAKAGMNEVEVWREWHLLKL